jgi:hypothetical protein
MSVVFFMGTIWVQQMGGLAVTFAVISVADHSSEVIKGWLLGGL